MKPEEVTALRKEFETDFEIIRAITTNMPKVVNGSLKRILDRVVSKLTSKDAEIEGLKERLKAAEELLKCVPIGEPFNNVYVAGFDEKLKQYRQLTDKP